MYVTYVSRKVATPFTASVIQSHWYHSPQVPFHLQFDLYTFLLLSRTWKCTWKLPHWPFSTWLAGTNVTLPYHEGGWSSKAADHSVDSAPGRVSAVNPQSFGRTFTCLVGHLILCDDGRWLPELQEPIESHGTKEEVIQKGPPKIIHCGMMTIMNEKDLWSFTIISIFTVSC